MNGNVVPLGAGRYAVDMQKIAAGAFKAAGMKPYANMGHCTFFLCMMIVYAVAGTMLITVANNSPNISSNRALMNLTIPYAKWSNGGTVCTQLNGCTKTIIVQAGPTVNLSDLLTAVVYLPLAYYFFAMLLTSPVGRETMMGKWFRGVRTDGNRDDKSGKWKPNKLYLGERTIDRAHWPTAMVFAVCEILILVSVQYMLGLVSEQSVFFAASCVLSNHAAAVVFSMLIHTDGPTHYDFSEYSTILLFAAMSVPFWLFWSVYFLSHNQAMVNGSNIPAGFQFGLYGVFIAQILNMGMMAILVPRMAKVFVYGGNEWTVENSTRLDFWYFVFWHLTEAVLLLGPVGLISQGWNFNTGSVYV